MEKKEQKRLKKGEISNLGYFTYMKFKGCEADAVILLDVDSEDERWADPVALHEPGPAPALHHKERLAKFPLCKSIYGW